MACVLSAVPVAQSPDVIVWDIGTTEIDPNDIRFWGRINGIAGYSFATQSCNAGDLPLDWYFDGVDNRHPVIGQNFYRLKDGRFEHIGQSWLKHGFCAVNETEGGCGPCQNSPCETLGVGCADTYTAGLNDGRRGRSKSFVHASSGVNLTSDIVPRGPSQIRGRLQVAVADIHPNLNPGVSFFLEGQYVTADDHGGGMGFNNTSWRPVDVLSISNIVGAGPTRRMQPAVYAWQELDPEVEIQRIDNVEGPWVGHYFLASRVSETGAGTWRYEYALHNLNSDQSAGSFTVELGERVHVKNPSFHDVDYHSGDRYDGKDWEFVVEPDRARWGTDGFEENPHANALRWGTLYNFGFEADVAPVRGYARVGWFKPGGTGGVTVESAVPGRRGVERR